jgi:penicillin amidase
VSFRSLGSSRVVEHVSASVVRSTLVWAPALAVLALAACDPSREPPGALCDRDPLIPGCTPPEPPFPGLLAPVEILRDDSGIPHVFAQNDADAYYASGYVQAFDRLFQMDLVRRRALGRRAEVLGAEAIGEDRMIRVLDIPRWGRTNAAATLREDPARYQLAQAWVAGVNRRIREVRSGAAPMPREFEALGYQPEEWQVADAFAVGKLLLFGNANQLSYDILSSIIHEYLPDLDARIGLMLPVRDSFILPEDERPRRSNNSARPQLPPTLPRALRPLPDDAEQRIRRFFAVFSGLRPGASNSWAVDGRHTANGRPWIAGDPHQPFQSPSLFWIHHLNSADAGGSLDVIGWSFVGAPGVHLGHNRHVVWTATTNYPDTMDLWDVLPGPNGGVMIAGTEVPIQIRHETIAVAGRSPVELDVEDVPGYGVLLPDDIVPLPIGRPGRRLLFAWTGFQPTHEFLSFDAIGRAQTLDEFDAAVDRNEIGNFNFLAASANGITYRSTPAVPDRGAPRGIRPFLVLDGDDPRTFWTLGRLDLARLPHSRGGSHGWLVTANNDPFGFTADGRIEGDPWYFGAYFDPGFRSARIEAEIARLVDRGGVTIEDMQALQDDTYSILADDVVPILVETWASRTRDRVLEPWRHRDDLDALVTRLASWDRRMERVSSEAVIFNAYVFFLAQRVLQDDLSIVFEPILDASPAYMFKFLSNALRGRAPQSDAIFAGEPRSVSIVRALEETETYLIERFGSASTGYRWGDVHGSAFRSIWGPRLDGGRVPTDGAEGTVNVSGSSFFDAEGRPRPSLDALSGPLFRMVAGFAEDGTPEAWANMPRGVSGDPESEHWDDLHEDWVENRYRRLRFRRSDVETAPHERMILSPE